jgi:hypothetical protein
LANLFAQQVLKTNVTPLHGNADARSDGGSVAAVLQ